MKPAEVRKQIKPARPRRSTCSKATICSRGTTWRSEFAALVDEGLHAFNVQSFYANEATSARGARSDDRRASLAAARTLPMMAPRRVLLVHEAERLLSPRKGKDEEQRRRRRRGGGKAQEER